MSRADHRCGHCRTRKEQKALDTYFRSGVQRIVVFGGREFEDINRMEFVIRQLVDQNFITDPCELVCGMARGADMTAYELFKDLGIRIHEFWADWENKGKAAGFIRNGEMANFADVGNWFLGWKISRNKAHDCYNGQGKKALHRCEILNAFKS